LTFNYIEKPHRENFANFRVFFLWPFAPIYRQGEDILTKQRMIFNSLNLGQLVGYMKILIKNKPPLPWHLN